MITEEFRNSGAPCTIIHLLVSLYLSIIQKHSSTFQKTFQHPFNMDTPSSNVPPSITGAVGGATNQEASWPADPSNYTLLGKVGQGAFASVWRAQCNRASDQDPEREGGSSGSGGRSCAIKIMDLEHVDTNFVGERCVFGFNSFFLSFIMATGILGMKMTHFF